MANSPFVSVIIPTFNRANSLPDAIRSVLSQGFSDLELIIVDDGSTDDTAAVVNQFQDSRIIYKAQENGGRNRARNTGLKLARGKYLAFLDSDDIWLQGHLARHVSALENVDDEVVLSIGAAIFVTSSSAQLSYPPLPKYSEPLRTPDLGSDLLFPFITQTWVMRRSLIEEIGGLNESIPAWEEHELLARFVSRYKIMAWQEPSAVHYEVEGSVTANIGGFPPEVASVFVDDFQRAYGGSANRRAAALFITGWSNARFGEFGLGKKMLRQSLLLSPFRLRVWSHVLLTLLGETSYRKAAAALAK